MKKLTFFIAILLCINCQKKPAVNQVFVDEDITNFWIAFDQINKTKDTVLQLKYLNESFLSKASKGQKGMIEARNYTANEYIEAMKSYPKFWKSIRKSTLKTKLYNAKIRKGLQELKELYPSLKPATIYYTMGVFRSPGTGFDDMALIGSEFALGTNNVVTTEFPENLSHVKKYFTINPTSYLDFLNIHEYIHTQQNESLNNILSQSLFEGIADFIAAKVTHKNAPFDYYNFGLENEERLKIAFEKEVFNIRKMGDWMWNQNNQFNTRDLIYFMGYKIAESNYNKSDNKALSIKNMIELDYSNETQIENFVDNSGYLSSPIETLYQKFETSRPKVIAIKQFKNGSQNVPANTTEITLLFSKKMDNAIKSTGFGDLGKEHFPKLIAIDFAEDGGSVTYKIRLEANKRYQILLENGYRTEDEIPLKPFLVDFKTGN
ncbi:hypothetical protein GCM10011416_17630 [Polaribacter pacificus]|uniref:DUF2268 domain-containing protein n=1 Tax=Polaribacter pacificus TaxID=1775173 RepID=A0A917MEB6_9FLAO|nr:hypothetical protein [Polaribacter pacificus]GGG99701.1 hypothetical protein GCM10011416_17630 [Polaribacter pacificus]